MTQDFRWRVILEDGLDGGVEGDVGYGSPLMVKVMPSISVKWKKRLMW